MQFTVNWIRMKCIHWCNLFTHCMKKIHCLLHWRTTFSQTCNSLTVTYVQVIYINDERGMNSVGSRLFIRPTDEIAVA